MGITLSMVGLNVAEAFGVLKMSTSSVGRSIRPCSRIASETAKARLRLSDDLKVMEVSPAAFVGSLSLLAQFWEPSLP